jgi:predicted GIY-YIG superfamily endonuclease
VRTVLLSLHGGARAATVMVDVDHGERRCHRRAKGRGVTHATVYRAFDTDGALLYVGSSTNPLARLTQHAATRWWWTQVVTVTLEHHRSPSAALAAERAAIRDEAPRHHATQIRAVA